MEDALFQRRIRECTQEVKLDEALQSGLGSSYVTCIQQNDVFHSGVVDMGAKIR
jgi:hypothetical protein